MYSDHLTAKFLLNPLLLFLTVKGGTDVHTHMQDGICSIVWNNSRPSERTPAQSAPPLSRPCRAAWRALAGSSYITSEGEEGRGRKEKEEGGGTASSAREEWGSGRTSKWGDGHSAVVQCPDPEKAPHGFATAEELQPPITTATEWHFTYLLLVCFQLLLPQFLLTEFHKKLAKGLRGVFHKAAAYFLIKPPCTCRKDANLTDNSSWTMPATRWIPLQPQWQEALQRDTETTAVHEHRVAQGFIWPLWTQLWGKCWCTDKSATTFREPDRFCVDEMVSPSHT